VQRLARQLVEPVLPHFSAGCARVRLGAQHAWYGEPADAIEGFSRPLWGLVPLTAGGGEFAHWERWRQGLVNGTDPDHPEFWGWAGDFDQRIVEMASLAFGLALTPEVFWTPLDAGARSRVAAWLGRVNEVQPVDSNWRFFRVLVNLALRRVGAACSRERLSADLERLDAFHLGAGWYSDGVAGLHLRDGRLGDYYGPMGMHFYGLLYAELERGNDPDQARVFEERARAFAGEFIRWFAPNGSALPFGRSLTYRCAQGAFWGALAFAGVEALPWAVIKGLYFRHLRWWMRQPIFTETGLLTIGYTYPNLLMAESYNGPGSPYWALKILLPLALPETHPFWQADEAPLPATTRVRTLPHAQLALSADGRSGTVSAITPGQRVGDWPRHAPQKYSKFAYSTRFGFTVPAGAPSLAEGGFDSMLAVSDDGRRYRGREECLEPELRDGVAYSRWLPWPDVEVRTWLVAAQSGHLRLHRVTSARRLWLAECGFATGYDRRTELRERLAPGGIGLASPSGHSALRDLGGGRSARTVELGVNSHLLFSLAAMPALESQHERGSFWLAARVVAGAVDQGADDVDFALSLGADQVAITCSGAPWWEISGAGCGVSSIDRLRWLETTVTWSDEMK
jgi:hypothetical protein